MQLALSSELAQTLVASLELADERVGATERAHIERLDAMRAECNNKLSSLQVECAAQLSLPETCAARAVRLPPAARAVGSCESSPGPTSLHGDAVQHQLHELERIESEAAGDANDHDESELNALVDEACASLKLQARLVTRSKALLRRLCLVRPCNWCWRTVLSPTALCRPLCGSCAIDPQWSFDSRPAVLHGRNSIARVA